MRLFWKIFCSMVLITSLACCIGGYALIDTQFRTSLSRETTAVYEENDLLRYALAREMSNIPVWGRDDLGQMVENISIRTGRGEVNFRISDEAGGTVGSHGDLPVLAAELTRGLNKENRGWHLAEVEGRKYIHAASPMTVKDGWVYLENCREVTELFAARNAQYRSYFWLMLALIVGVGALSLTVSAVMLLPLNRLSVAARRMAGGELTVRVPEDRDDELGQLSRDFNAMADKLEALVLELQAASKRQEDFIGSFAHEIKTPLTSIIGYADLLRSRPFTEDQVRESVGYIFSEGRRMEALSRKLMDLIVLDKQQFTMRPVALDFFLRRVAKALLPPLQKAGIRLFIRTEPVTAMLEPDLMETVCMNLMDNARKALPEGGRILLECGREVGGCFISVTDNGKGIPKEELSRITEAFYMVDKSRARAQGGAGLGLALVQRIVGLHNGHMEFQSVEGRGTKVIVHLHEGEEA